jgi:hypothetical protein
MSSAIPLMFTLPPSNRHEVILLDTESKPTLKALNKQISATMKDSPNCAECNSPCLPLSPFLLCRTVALHHRWDRMSGLIMCECKVMSKHKPADASSGEMIQEFRIHWSEAGRDRKVWPEYTVLTDANFAAVLELLRAGAGKDVLEVKVGKDE